MPWQREEAVHTHCYPGGKSIVVRVTGIVLMAIGAILVLFCVPFWAWIAAIGGIMILVGILLIRK